MSIWHYHKKASLPAELTQRVEECSFYPELIISTIIGSLGSREVDDFMVYFGSSFSGREVQRHMTVMVLTHEVLIVVEADDNDRNLPDRVLTVAEVVPLSKINSVTLTQSVSKADTSPETQEVWLSVNWGTRRRMEFGPAVCQDRECQGDHGWSGVMTPDDVVLRVAPAADGPRMTYRLVEFAERLQELVGRCQRG